MKSCHLCGIFALVFAPCALAVSITQTATYTNNAVSSGTAAAEVATGLWSFTPFSPSLGTLTSVIFTSSAHFSVDVFEINAFNLPNYSFQPLAQLTGTVFFPTFFITAPPVMFPTGTGTPVILGPQEGAHGSLAFDQNFTTTFSTSTDFAYFTTGSHLVSVANGIRSNSNNGSTNTNASYSLGLVYNYSAATAVSAPDAGFSAVLLAFACIGIFLLHRRQEPGMA